MVLAPGCSVVLVSVLVPASAGGRHIGDHLWITGDHKACGVMDRVPGPSVSWEDMLPVRGACYF
jgi:hypothetical protein